MTIPVERTRAVLDTRDFLTSLLNPKLTPRVPADIRRRARGLLKHYPAKFHMTDTCIVLPDTWEMPK